MKSVYENIRVAAAVSNHRISEQNLALIQQKYGIDDMEGCLRFCAEQKIEVYNEEDEAETQEHSNQETASESQIASEKMYQRKLELASEITERIMYFATKKAREERKRLRYARYVSERFCKLLRHFFTVSEMEFILDHLKEENDDGTIYKLTDDFDQEMCDRLNEKFIEMMNTYRKSRLRKGVLNNSSTGNSEEDG